MQRIDVDCRSGNIQYIDLASDEETERLQESEQNEVQQSIEAKQQIKDRLVTKLTEFREMKSNQDIFIKEDLDKKQDEIDKLKEKLV